MSKKIVTASDLGRMGGLVGGKSKSPAKMAACRKNWAKAIKALKRKRALDTKAAS